MKNEIVSAVCLLVFITSSVSCDKSFHDPLKHFAHAKEYKLEVINTVGLEEYEVFRPSNVVKVGTDYYIRDSSNPLSVKLLNPSTGYIKTIVSKGSGPEELNSIDRIMLKDSLVVVFDHTRRKLYRLRDGNNEHGGIVELRQYSEDIRPFIVDIHNDMMLASGMLEDSWVNLYNSMESSVLSLEFPAFEETSNLDNIQKSILFMSTFVNFKPDGKAFALATLNEGVFAIYKENPNDGWQNVIEWMYFPPKFKELDVKKTGTPLAYTRENVIAFYGLACTDEYIYALYSGKEVGNGSMDAYLCQHVLVYDWEGNPVKHYLLDIPLYSMGVDEKAGILYGIGYDPEGCIIEYKLK